MGAIDRGRRPLEPPEGAQRRRIERYSAWIESEPDAQREDRFRIAVPVTARIFTGGMPVGVIVARGEQTHYVVAHAVLGYFLGFDWAGELADEFIEDFLSEMGSKSLAITGPEIYCWLASLGKVADPPADWNWGEAPPY